MQKTILIALVMLVSVSLIPIKMAAATVDDSSGESTGGDTSGNFLPNAPPGDFPGTGPMFDNSPPMYRGPGPYDTPNSPPPVTSVPQPQQPTAPQQQGARQVIIDTNAPASEFCNQFLQLPKNAQSQFIESLDINTALKVMNKMMTCANDMISQYNNK